jgi:hypothetical protein
MGIKKKASSGGEERVVGEEGEMVAKVVEEAV